MTALREKYNKEVVPKLADKLGIKNPMAIPRISKVIINMGFGVADKDEIKSHTEELAAITGQKPAVTKSKKSISNFKLREDMNIGAKVTLRGAKMYEFLDRLINAVLPRIRDFRGVSPKSFDKYGNYSMGIRDQMIFPELDPDKIKHTQGMDVTIVTTTSDVKQAREMLKMIGMPFAEKEKEKEKESSDGISEVKPKERESGSETEEASDVESGEDKEKTGE